MAVRIQIRNGTAEEWAEVNPTLAVGELALEIDTRKFKIGDGIHAWNDLAYATQGERGPSGPQGKGLEFLWDGTKLGVRVEGELTYQYVDLQGPKGERGVKGDKGDKGDVYFPTFSVDANMELTMHDNFNYDGTISFRLDNGCLIQEVI